jgi:hypothetical protein
MESLSLFPPGDLKLRTLLQKLYSQISKTPIIDRTAFTSVCAPRRDGSDARISHLPIDSNLALNALRIQQASGLLPICLSIIARTNLVIALV